MLFKIEKLLLSIQNGNFILSLKEKAMLLSLRLSVPIVASLWAPEKINEIKIEWSCSFSLLEDT